MPKHPVGPKRVTWRDECRPIIARVIAEVGTDDKQALRVALRNAWRWGPRQYWPYKVWCSEVRRQLNGEPEYVPGQRKPVPPAVGQKELF